MFILASSDHDLQHALVWFAAEFEEYAMTVGYFKSKVMILDWKNMKCSLRAGMRLYFKWRSSGISEGCSQVMVEWTYRSTDWGLVLSDEVIALICCS